MTDLYQYTGCGLDWVYLVNGYRVHETPYGEGISVQNVDGLHDLIARTIVTRPVRMRGQELRFMRSYWDLTQAGMGKRLGLSRSQIARHEANSYGVIPATADICVRSTFAVLETRRRLADRVHRLRERVHALEECPDGLQQDVEDLVRRVAEVIDEIDRHGRDQEHFEETPFGWKTAA